MIAFLCTTVCVCIVVVVDIERFPCADGRALLAFARDIHFPFDIIGGKADRYVRSRRVGQLQVGLKSWHSVFELAFL